MENWQKYTKLSRSDINDSSFNLSEKIKIKIERIYKLLNEKVR